MLTGTCEIACKKKVSTLRWTVAKSPQSCLDVSKDVSPPPCCDIVKYTTCCCLSSFPLVVKSWVELGLNQLTILQTWNVPFPLWKVHKERQSWTNAATESSLTLIPAVRTNALQHHRWWQLIIHGNKWMGVISPCGGSNLKVQRRLVAVCNEIRSVGACLCLWD